MKNVHKEQGKYRTGEKSFKRIATSALQLHPSKSPFALGQL